MKSFRTCTALIHWALLPAIPRTLERPPPPARLSQPGSRRQVLVQLQNASATAQLFGCKTGPSNIPKRPRGHPDLPHAKQKLFSIEQNVLHFPQANGTERHFKPGHRKQTKRRDTLPARFDLAHEFFSTATCPRTAPLKIERKVVAKSTTLRYTSSAFHFAKRK